MNKLFTEQHEHAPEAVLIIELFIVQYHILEVAPLVLLMNELLMNESFTEHHEHVPEAVLLVLLMNKLLMKESFTVLVLLTKELFTEQHKHVPEAVPLIHDWHTSSLSHCHSH